MGSKCCKNIKSKEPIKVVARIENMDYELPETPESFEILQQNLLVLAKQHYGDVEPYDYFKMQIESQKEKFIVDEESYLAAKSLLNNKGLTLVVTRCSFLDLFNLDLSSVRSQQLNASSTLVLQSLEYHKESILQFLKLQWKLLSFTEHLNLFTACSSLDSAILALLLCYACECKGSFEVIGLKLSEDYPFIDISACVSENCAKLNQLWQSFIKSYYEAKRAAKVISKQSKELLDLVEHSSKKQFQELGHSHLDFEKFHETAVDFEKKTSNIQKQLKKSVSSLFQIEKGDWLSRICMMVDLAQVKLNNVKLMFGLKGKFLKISDILND